MARQTSYEFTVILSEVTAMRDGFVCIAGWSVEEGRMVRPLRSNGHPHWPEALAECGVLVVGNELVFRSEGKSSDRDAPHKNDDVVVASDPRFLRRCSAAELCEVLEASVAPALDDIFGGEMFEQKFVRAGAKCPSLGAIEVARRDLCFDRPAGKLRCMITQGDSRVSLPVTDLALRRLYERRGIGEVDSLRRRAARVHVRIGLAHAWAGAENNFVPHRCYAQVNGLIFLEGEDHG